MCAFENQGQCVRSWEQRLAPSLRTSLGGYHMCPSFMPRTVFEGLGCARYSTTRWGFQAVTLLLAFGELHRMREGDRVQIISEMFRELERVARAVKDGYTALGRLAAGWRCRPVPR